MTILQAIILGLVQGLTEFLPISSSAHLAFIPNFFNWENTSTDFDVFLHVATIMAVIIYFRKDIQLIIKGIFSKNETESNEQKSITLNIIVGFIVLIPFVFLFKDFIASTQDNIVLTYVLFIIFGIPLIFIEKLSRKNTRTISEIGWRSSLIIGFTQCLALFSGVSRSGITIITGMTQGMTKFDAKKFTFLLSIPTILAGFSLELVKLLQNFQFQESWLVITIGSLAAFVSGMFAIKIMMELLKNKSLAIFGYYRLILGIILLIITLA